MLANIGGSDLELDGLKLHNDKVLQYVQGENFRERTRHLHENIKSHLSNLSLPILAPLLEHLEENDERPSHVFLFCTDQSGEGEAGHRQDTVYAGQIIGHMLEKEHGFTTSTVEMQANPHDYDHAASWYRRRLPEIMPARHSRRPIASVTGGTPAMNFALLEALSGQDRPFSVYYVARQPEERPGKVERVMVGRFLQLEKLMDMIDNAIRSFGYEVASTMASNFGVNPDIQRFLLALRKRTHLDFKDALEKVKSIGPEASRYDIVEDVKSELEQLVHAQQNTDYSKGCIDRSTARMYMELAIQAERAFQGNRLETTLSRIHVLTELLHRHLLAQAGCKIPRKFDKLCEKALRICGKNDMIRGWLGSKKEEIRKLRQLRNEAVLGHGVGKITSRAIADRWGSHSIASDYKELLSKAYPFLAEETSVLQQPERIEEFLYANFSY